MNPETNVTQEPVKEQQQAQGTLAAQAQDSPQVQVMNQQKEDAPDIKTEENKKNWNEFRAAREAERKAREDAERRVREKAAEAEALKAALEAALRPTHNQQQYYPPQDIYGNPQQPEESDDARIQRKVEEALAKRYALEEQQRREREAREMPQRLQASYPDFNKVCTQENLDYFEFHHPEIARGYALAPESEAKWAGIYAAVKKYVPNTMNAQRDANRVEQNLNKPQSLSKTGAAVGGHAMPAAELTEQRKAENWKRMQKILNSVE